MNFTGPLFVVGMPRSGTKLLRGLLNQHPLIGIPDAETEFLPAWHARWPSFGDLSQADRFAAFYEQVTGAAYFTYLREERGRQIDRDAWSASCRSFDLPGVFEALLRLDGDVPPGGIWGDKSPGYIAHLGLLDHLFPRARVVHIVRDVRDYCLSIHKAWGKRPLRAAQRWADRVSAAHRQGPRRFGERWLEVRYEDLLARPQDVLERICALAEVDFVPGMLRPAGSTENLGDTKGKVGIQADNKGKWRARMSPGQVRAIERLAGEVLVELGYPVDYRGPARRLGRGRMLAMQLMDGWHLLGSDVDQRGWLGAARFRLRMARESGALGFNGGR